VAAPHPFSTVCFRHLEVDNDRLAREATATGEVFVAATRLNGKAAIRLAIGNARTTEDDVRRTWEVLRSCAR
jgi:aromatic-L-amino-acid decarboxylase